MIASAKPRLRLPAPRGALPLALLALALASVFVFGDDRSHTQLEAESSWDHQLLGERCMASIELPGTPSSAS